MSPEYNEMLGLLRETLKALAVLSPPTHDGMFGNKIRAAITKAEKKQATCYYSLNVNKTVYTCLSIEEAEDMQSRLGGSISHQFTNEG